MNTVYICMICILFRLWYCKKIFVQRDTTVEIVCPTIATGNDYVIWHFKQSTISDGKNVNPKFKNKYRVTNTRNLQIVNFTYGDEGKYTCKELSYKEIREDTVIVAVCHVPKEISSLSFVLEGSSEGISHQTNVLCTQDMIVESGKMFNGNKKNYLLRATLKLHISRQCNLDKGRGNHKKATIWNHTCLTLNEDQCVASNETIMVNVEWISKEERSFTKKSKGFLQQPVDVYTGDCASLNIKTNSNCDGNIKIYLTNDVLYLNNFIKTTTETFLCHIYRDDNPDEIIRASKFVPADIYSKQLTYAFGGIAAVLIVLLIFSGAVIKTMALKVNLFTCSEDEHTHDEDVVPDNVVTTDSVNLQSIDLVNCSSGRNSASSRTLSGNASSYYQFDVSGNSNTEAINEQKAESVNNTDNYLDNCFENDIYSAGNLYVNTNVMNTYEQLETNSTTDIQTYEDFSYDH